MIRDSIAGRRNISVGFYRSVISGQNASGEDVIVATLLGTCWVHIAMERGREVELDREKRSQAKFRVVMDHPLDTFTLQRKDYLLWGSRRLEIVDVEDTDQTRHSLVVYAEEYGV